MHEHVEHRQVERVGVDPLRHGQVALWVHVDAQHAVALLGERRREVERRGRLGDAALLVGEGDDLGLAGHVGAPITVGGTHRPIAVRARAAFSCTRSIRANMPDRTHRPPPQPGPLGLARRAARSGRRPLLRRRRARRRRRLAARAGVGRRARGGRRGRGARRAAPAVPHRLRHDLARAPRRARHRRRLLARVAGAGARDRAPLRARHRVRRGRHDRAPVRSCTTASTSPTRRWACSAGSTTSRRGCARWPRSCGRAAGCCSSTCTRSTRCSTPSTRCGSTSRTATRAAASSTRTARTRRPTPGRAPRRPCSTAHSLGELVNAAVEAGLRIERLEEHVDIGLRPARRRVPARGRRALPAAAGRRAAPGRLHAHRSPAVGGRWRRARRTTAG